MSERIVFYIMLELVNFLILPYEVLVLKFSFKQSLICRLFTSLTDIVIVFFFLSTDGVWSSKEIDRNIVDHFLAGVKLASQSPVIYIAKIIFVNNVVIRGLQKLNLKISLITWPNIGKAMISAITFCFVSGALYSIFREEILEFLKNFITGFQ
ncbi:hypothetical protein CVU82_02750 [Candidatus Falkowbacteria bacterium HGW-Falkowbacteria-1]|jgi:hypothetical protein|uniref:Uncharacterized protein n=1 Tax=Candidatus Falkowbacteria bacterium HGW-Falkowbacteria-1 TaxID=2013768 RepID=A0A2N2E9V0_9BACT|nr:MAG: hypothetical protein CVU82_02750 [Candidatus Falkowbacteria bacterium HGW-Falkowbacteria-1]